jgi:hypothetical protein
VMESWSEVRPSLSTVSAYSGLIDRNGTEQRGNVQRLLPVLDSRYVGLRLTTAPQILTGAVLGQSKVRH